MKIKLIEERGIILEGDYIMIPANVNILATNRECFLTVLQKGGVYAEVGVAQGGFSQKILTGVEPDKLYLIDAWDSIECTELQMQKAQTDEFIFRQVFENIPEVEIIKTTSVHACRLFPVETFDFVYLDASHDEKNVLIDLLNWWPKVKPGGYLMGHDFCVTGTWYYGVVPAVYSFIKTNDIGLFGMTGYNGEEFPSFILQKP